MVNLNSHMQFVVSGYVLGNTSLEQKVLNNLSKIQALWSGGSEKMEKQNLKS